MPAKCLQIIVSIVWYESYKLIELSPHKWGILRYSVQMSPFQINFNLFIIDLD